MKFNYKKDFIAFIKFGITGVLNTAVDFVVFFLVSPIIGIYPAQIVGYTCGMINSFFINRNWTFKSGESFFSPTFVKFAAANLITMGISIVVLAVFTQFLLLDILISKILTTVITLIFNFLLSRLWVFRNAGRK